MKKNKSMGFMLTETLIVASFISVVLIYLFVQFRNINNNYDVTLKYNGVNEMYILGEFKKYLEQENLEQLSLNLSYDDKSYYDLSTCSDEIFSNTDYCTVLLNISNIDEIIYMKSDNTINTNSFNPAFNDYLNSIKKVNGMYILAAYFKDGKFASVKMNGYVIPTLTEALKQQSLNNNTNNPGLYFDNGEYVFKASSVDTLNNNIDVFGYSGRIISLNDNGVKVYLNLKRNVIYNNTNSYFTSSKLLQNGEYLSNNQNNSVLFENLNSSVELPDNILADYHFGVGSVSSIIGRSYSDILSDEFSTTISSKIIATLNISDLIKTSLNTSCNYESITNDCLNDNWLNSNLWTMNYKSETEIWNTYSNQFLSSTVLQNAYRNAYLVILLKPDVKVKGDGTINNPYKVV